MNAQSSRSAGRLFSALSVRWVILVVAVPVLTVAACGTTPAAKPPPSPMPSATSVPAYSATATSVPAYSATPTSVPAYSATAASAPSKTTPAPSETTTSVPSGTGSGAGEGVGGEARAYVDAVNARDLDALVSAFAPDAEIIDVSRSIRGHDAIREWAGDEVIGGTLRVVSIAEDRADGQKLLVHWAPAGSDGWRAHYDFTVGGGRIVRADLQYA
ncbi:nuclear transport factor 2 family protein [Nonomuraea insulae]|uniref:Nuclear transport factor 2 family protein n=1 Tax=Nonomuraea insulae TaxID=1616787 RepID=A0ABW1D5D4_9ACTN